MYGLSWSLFGVLTSSHVGDISRNDRLPSNKNVCLSGKDRSCFREGCCRGVYELKTVELCSLFLEEGRENYV